MSHRLSHDAPAAEIPGPLEIAPEASAARPERFLGRRLLLALPPLVLGAAVTALLSLDTTAVMLTPVVLAFVGRLDLKAKPFLFACAFIANTGSLLLPVSNLTNLLAVHRFEDLVDPHSLLNSFTLSGVQYPFFPSTLLQSLL